MRLQPAAAVGPLETIWRDGRVEAIDYCTSEDGVLGFNNADANVSERDGKDDHLPND